MVQADKTLRHSKANEQGILQPRSKHRLDLRVTHGTLDRALRLMDGLVRGLEERGMPVSVVRGDATATSTAIDGVAVTFFLEERIQRVERPPTPQQRLQSWGYLREYDYVATGDLRLRIDGLAYLGVRQSWADGKRRRMEGSLGSFVLGLRQAASALKHQRAEQAEAQRQYEQERQRRMEAELVRQLDETRVGELQRQVAHWQQVRLVRDYIEAVKAAGVVYLPANVKISTLDEWVRWAGGYAERADPLTRELPGAEDL